MIKRLLGLLVLAALTISMSSSGLAAAKPKLPAPLSPAVTVSVGLKFAVSDAGVIIGMAKGYFKEMGINIDATQFNSGQEMINQLAAGGLDVGCTVTSAGLFNAMIRDIPVRIVADKGYNVPGKGYYRLVVRKDLANKIKDFDDLKGRKCGIVGSASLDEIALDRVLQKAGLSTKDVDLQIIRSFPDLVVALGNKSIDAGMLIEPFCTLAVDNGFGDLWKDPEKYDPDAQVALLVYGTKILKRPEVARRFMIAYLRGVRDYNDAFFKNKNRAEIISILTKNTTVTDSKLLTRMLPAGINPDGYVRNKGVQSDINWYRSRNLLTSKITLSEAIDNSYVDYAISILGKYED